MGTMVENIREICREKGIAVSRLESDLGYGNGFLNPKKIKAITTTRAAEIAEYLGVSLDALMGMETKKDQPGEGLVNDDPELTDYLQALQSRPEMKMLFHTFKSASKAEIEAIVTAWEARNNIKGE